MTFYLPVSFLKTSESFEQSNAPFFAGVYTMPSGRAESSVLQFL